MIGDLTRMMDISEQLSIALINISELPRGIVARIYAVGLGIIAVALLALAWYFDYSATIEYALPVVQMVVGSIPPHYAVYVPLISWMLTILPTAVEMFLPRAVNNSFIAGLLFYAILLFDMATDTPRVAVVLSLYGVTKGIAYWISFPVLLLFASIGFELLFVICAVCALFLALRG